MIHVDQVRLIRVRRVVSEAFTLARYSPHQGKQVQQQIQEPRAGVTYSPSDHQRRIDEIQAAIRAEAAPAPERTLFKPAPKRSPPSTVPLDHRLSEELECIRRHLEQLGGVLAANPLLVQRHATQLQSIDLINQVLGHISGIIASEDRELAVEQVTLRELRSRLQRKPLAPL